MPAVAFDGDAERQWMHWSQVGQTDMPSESRQVQLLQSRCINKLTSLGTALSAASSRFPERWRVRHTPPMARRKCLAANRPAWRSRHPEPKRGPRPNPRNVVCCTCLEASCRYSCNPSALPNGFCLSPLLPYWLPGLRQCLFKCSFTEALPGLIVLLLRSLCYMRGTCKRCKLGFTKIEDGHAFHGLARVMFHRAPPSRDPTPLA